MAHEVCKCLTNYDCKNKILAVTCDNAMNNENMIGRIKEKLPESRMDADSFIRCLGHVLNLVCKTILKELNTGTIEEADTLAKKEKYDPSDYDISPILKIRSVSIHCNRSPQRFDKWSRICQIHNTSIKHIQYDIKIRWNSTYRMICNALDLIDEYNEYVSVCSLDVFEMSQDEWSYLRQIKQVFEKFDEFTCIVSKNDPQITMSLPIYYALCDHLSDIKDQEKEYKDFDHRIISAVKVGYSHFEKYYDGMDANDTYFIAASLDPRFKMSLIEQVCHEDDVNDIKSHLKNKLKKMYPQESDQAVNTTEPKGLLSKMLANRQKASFKTSDVDRYFDSNYLDLPEECNILQWWRDHQTEYPVMARVARDYLAIPCASVSVERCFSSGRDVLGH
ncbi:AC transposase, partial [Acrasis kona]